MEDDNSVTESYQSRSAGTSRTPVSRQDSDSVAESRQSRSTPVSGQESDSVAESRQSRSAQSGNNPRTPVSRQDSDSVAESRQSRSAQSGNNPRTPVSRQASSADADLDIFQSYSRFRLKVVSMFGSMASGLYELGADPETGRISQEDFVQVCANTLEMMSEREALSLFRHFTNADPFGAEDEAFATFKDLGIDEEEWKYVVAAKQQAKTTSTSIPFSSVPSGSSAGLYHRPINVNQVSEQRQAQSSEAGTPRSPVRGGTARSFKSFRVSSPLIGSCFGCSNVLSHLLMANVPVLDAILAARARELPHLPQHVWQQVHAHVGQEHFPEDAEGIFVVRPRQMLEATLPGDGWRHSINLLFVGNSNGIPKSDTLWYKPATTMNCLPAFVADVVRPRWDNFREMVTTLCCETQWSLEDEREKFLANFVMFDWQGLSDRDRRHESPWGRMCRDEWVIECETDRLGGYDAYVFYFSASCSSSFGYVCHRLGQLQEARSKERFRMQEYQSSIGYGCKAYDHTVQRRFGSFPYVPLVLLSLPGPCHCGSCRGPSSQNSAARLAQQVACPLLEGMDLRKALRHLVAEIQRIDASSKLAPVRVPRHAKVDPTLHGTG
eukprot:s146_g13.t1